MVCNVEDANAQGTFSVVLDFPKEHNLLSKVCAISIDSVAVMISKRQ